MYHLSLNKMWYFDFTRISQKSIFKSKSESSLHHSSFQIKVFHHQEWIHFTAMFATPQYNGWMVSLLIFSLPLLHHFKLVQPRHRQRAPSGLLQLLQKPQIIANGQKDDL